MSIVEAVSDICCLPAPAEPATVLAAWQARVPTVGVAVASDATPAIAAQLRASHRHDSALCQIVAELGKDEGSRDLLGSGLLLLCIDVIAHAAEQKDWATRFQALRALGNMCFDNDANRERVLVGGGVAVLFKTMAAFQQEDAGVDPGEHELSRRATAGVVLNLALDHDAMQKELLQCGVMESLAWLMQRAATLGEGDLAFRALNVFQADNDALLKFCEQGGLRGVVDRVKGLDADDDAPEDLGQLLHAVAKQDRLLPFLAKDAILADLVTLAVVPANPAAPGLAGTVAMVVAVAAGDDACLACLFASPAQQSALLARVLEWLAVAQSCPSNYDFPSAGALLAGNLARSDALATIVGTYPGLLAALIALLPTDRMGFQHNSLASLKNLTRVPALCEAALKLELLSGTVSALESASGPVQYRAASLLRFLCAGGPSSAAVAHALSGMAAVAPRLVHLGAQEDEHVRAEATRALAALVKAGGGGGVVTAGGVPRLVALLSSSHATLQSEMLLALVLLAAQQPEAARAALAATDAQARVAHIIDTATAPELRNNAQTLQTILMAHTVTAVAAPVEAAGAAVSEPELS